MSEDQHGPLLRWAQAIGDDNIVHRIEALVAEYAELRAGLPAAMEHIPPVNPSEGRVPVSWNECADWLDAYGREFVHHRHGKLWLETNLTGSEFRNPKAMESFALNEYRLLPPPNLSPAPECMDGGGWLGQGKDVPDGWEWRRLTGIQAYAPGTTRPTVDWLVQCRPPVPKREPEWVPLTKLVGRTVWGETVKVRLAQVGVRPRGCWMRPDLTWTPFPDGTLDLDTGRVKVEPEGEQ